MTLPNWRSIKQLWRRHRAEGQSLRAFARAHADHAACRLWMGRKGVRHV